MPRPDILTKGRPTDPFENSSISSTVEKLKTLGARQGAEQDAKTPEDAARKLEKAKKMGALSDEYFPEMIDPAELAMMATGVAGGVVAGNLAVAAGKLLDRVKSALGSNRMRKMEIKKAKQAAERPVKMPPIPKNSFNK
jgi:hypothetical protein